MVFFQLDGPSEPSEPAPGASFPETNRSQFALPIRGSFITIIRSAPAASGQEMARNRPCAKQRKPGPLI